MRYKFPGGWADYELVDEIRVGDRMVPQILKVTLPGNGYKPQVNMTIDSSNGVPSCTNIQMSVVDPGRDIRTTDLRDIKLEDWIESVVSALGSPINVDENGEEITVRDDALNRNHAVNFVRAARRSARRKVTPELLQHVAEVYQQQESHRIEAIQAAFGTSYRTAARYVQLARQQNLLPERKA